MSKIETNNSILRLSSVEISDRHIAENDGNLPIVFLPRNQIVSMSLHRGIKSERPMIDVVIGSIFILIGIYIFMPMLFKLLNEIYYGPLAPRYGGSKFVSLGLVFFPLGIYVIFDAFRKRYFILVITGNGKKRKIVFNTSVSYTELSSFINQAQINYGYHITERIPEECTTKLN